MLFICGLFVVTVITKYHKLGGFHNRNVFVTVLSLEFQDQGFGRFSFSESFPSSFANDLDRLMVFLPGLSSVYTPWCLFHLLKGQQCYWVRISSLQSHLTLTTSLKTYHQIQSLGGLRFQHMNSGEIIVQSIMVNNFCFHFLPLKKKMESLY